jgi:hypothetical protein
VYFLLQKYKILKVKVCSLQWKRTQVNELFSSNFKLGILGGGQLVNDVVRHSMDIYTLRFRSKVLKRHQDWLAMNLR